MAHRRRTNPLVGQNPPRLRSMARVSLVRRVFQADSEPIVGRQCQAAALDSVTGPKYDPDGSAASQARPRRGGTGPNGTFPPSIRREYAPGG